MIFRFGTSPRDRSGSRRLALVALPIAFTLALATFPAHRASAAVVASASGELAGKVVTIDPGHNGGNFSDPAYINAPVFNGRESEACDTTGTETDSGYTEALFNWNVSQYLAADLRALGAQVVLTRSSNDGVGPCITQRTAIGNNAHSDAAVSIHADGGPPGGTGFAILEPVADGPNDGVIGSSQVLGTDLRQAFLAGTGEPVSNYQGVNGIEPRDDLAGVNLTTVPKVFIECANMRNATDAARLTSPAWQASAAEAIAKGLTTFLGGSTEQRSAVYAYGSAPAPAAPFTSSVPLVGSATMPLGQGYWLVSSNGAVFAEGDAKSYGDMSATHLNQPIVGMAATPDGRGYWLVASDGGIFAFGDAAFHGSTGSIHLNEPVVAIATDPATGGYWLVASDGGVFAFDAPFLGSMGGSHLNQPVVGMTGSADGGGYWLVASDGGIFAFGDAPFHGSTGSMHLNQPVVAMATDLTTGGYWLLAADGGLFSFDAPFFGSRGGAPGGDSFFAIVPVNRGGGYFLVGTQPA